MKATIYTADGSVIKCSFCDKDAGFFISAIDESVNYCREHYPLRGEPEAKFVYQEKGNTFSNVGKILEHTWTIDLTNSSKKNKLRKKGEAA